MGTGRGVESTDEIQQTQALRDFLKTNPALSIPNISVGTTSDPVYLILKLILNSQSITKEEIVSDLDLTSFVLDLVMYLRKYNLIVEDNHGFKVNTALLYKGGEDFSLPDTSSETVSDATPETESKTVPQSTSESQEIPTPGVVDPGSAVTIPKGEPANESVELEQSSKTRERLRVERFQQTQDTSFTTEPDEELDQLFDEVLGDPLETVMADFEEIMIDDENGAPKIIKPVAKLLAEYNYLDENNLDDALNNREYNILLSIIREHPISQEEIEKMLEDSSSLSMIMSNLQADNLIKQTNDYRWTFTKQTQKAVQDYIGTQRDESTKQDDEIKMVVKRADLTNKSLFLNTCRHFDYIGEETADIIKLSKEYSEFEVINLIRTNQRISTEEIKEKAEGLPVVIQRMISRLHADNTIVQDINNNWMISPYFRYIMVKDELEMELDEDELRDLEQKLTK